MSGIAIVMTAPGRSLRQLDWLVGAGTVTSTSASVTCTATAGATDVSAAAVTGAASSTVVVDSAGCVVVVSGDVASTVVTPASAGRIVVGGAVTGRDVDGTGVRSVAATESAATVGGWMAPAARNPPARAADAAAAHNATRARWPHVPRMSIATIPFRFHDVDKSSTSWYGVGWVRGSSSLDERPIGSSGSMLPSRHPR